MARRTSDNFQHPRSLVDFPKDDNVKELEKT